ncbi:MULTISPECIES: glycosyltransferase [Gammaproteobacteria]|uniref:glycosyltransferase n=1 Tax=Gammaproteobacteria TaxID=1236 RepID=UPI003A924ADE
MKRPLVSIVIRTLNEEQYLNELLQAVKNQDRSLFDIETVVVDSGSTDSTLDIAQKFGCRVTYIEKSQFTFGRSLNVGCEFAKGSYLIFVSGHCVPCDEYWVNNLVRPLMRDCVYSYGRQLGRDTTKFSECQLFSKYFPEESRIPQEGFFCNNANSAIRKDIWEAHHFDESLTGCEDMYLAKELVGLGLKLAYVADAGVYHIHDESWERVKIRYEREAVALQKILPQVHVTLFDTIKYISTGIIKDIRAALSSGVLLKELNSIIRFRFAQYIGAYKGNHVHRKVSEEMKLRYFYPRVTDMNVNTEYKLGDRDSQDA